MTKYKHIIMGTVACLGLAGFAMSGEVFAAEQAIEFEDSIFCNAVYESIGNVISDNGQNSDSVASSCNNASPSIVINAADTAVAIARVTTLNLTDMSYPGITNLTGINAFTSLKNLGLSFQSGITSLEPIDELTSLESLDISGINADLNPIADLINLKNLQLRGAHVSNSKLNKIRNLTNLEVLSLINNDITDIGILANLTKLTSLDISYNDITSIAALEELTELNTLYMYKNSISDLEPISSLAQLRVLSANGNNIFDITPIAELTNLKVLYLADNYITDVTPLADFDSFHTLVLSGNHIFDFTPILDVSIIADNDIIENPDFRAAEQTLSVNIPDNTYQLPKLFQQVNPPIIVTENTTDVTAQTLYDLLYNGPVFDLENAVLNDDKTTLTVLDTSKPAKITIPLDHDGIYSAAGGSTITIFSDNNSAAIADTVNPTRMPNTGLFTAETAGAIARNLGIILVAVTIIVAPIALTVKRAHARPQLGRKTHNHRRK